MGQALYRKYRPRSFTETVGQEAITKTLNEAIKSGRISHAYLFAGPRGVGKTSIARILAHEINSLPYKHDSVHLDIIEIDAASNRRIDEIRDLREKVHIAPTAVKYKVYIIDEVHMLTKEAFNALLKTLEEPPAHCIFILATTEAHKLPETIISRTQRFNFKPISTNSAKKHLQKLARSEKIDIEDEALALLADFSDGSLRDTIGMLDQLSGSGRKITEGDVRNLLGLPPKNIVNDLAEYIEHGKSREVLIKLDLLKEQGANPVVIAKNLSEILRQKMIEQELSGQWISKLLRELLGVTAASNPQEALELAVLEAATTNVKAVPQATPLRVQQSDNITEKKEHTSPFNLGDWGKILNRAKDEAPTLYSALRLAEPSISNGRLVLKFPFSLHQKKIKEAKALSLVGRLIEDISGASLPIDCEVDKNLANKKDSPTPENSDFVAIKSIFGSAEVLES